MHPSRARPDRPQARVPPPPVDGVSLDVALEQLELLARRRLGLPPAPTEADVPVSYVVNPNLSAASQSLYATRPAQGNVVTINTGAHEPVYGLMENSWTTCSLLFESLPEDDLHRLVGSSEGATLLLTPGELDKWGSKIAPFLTLCSELRNSDTALDIMGWYARVQPVCADIERQHCEFVKLANTILRVVVVHFGHGLFGHLLFLTGRMVDLTVEGVVKELHEHPHELFRFYAGFVSVSIELASKDLQ